MNKKKEKRATPAFYTMPASTPPHTRIEISITLTSHPTPH
jgi:hypothetical protein